LDHNRESLNRIVKVDKKKGRIDRPFCFLGQKFNKQSEAAVRRAQHRPWGRPSKWQADSATEAALFIAAAMRKDDDERSRFLLSKTHSQNYTDVSWHFDFATNSPCCNTPEVIMSGSSTLKTDQHYVPQCLLRAFETLPGSDQVFAFAKAEDRIFLTSIRNLGCERDFYTIQNSDALDQTMNRADGALGGLLCSIREKESVGWFSTEQKTMLAGSHYVWGRRYLLKI
jgi:hypothetical protein